jgi:hypothetical protein
MTPYRVKILSIERIRPTEEASIDHIHALADKIESARVWTHPILVDDVVCALMDGHHRYHAARRIGLRAVPAVMLSYDDRNLRLEAWRAGEIYTAGQLRAIALSGSLLPPKSTRHVLEASIPHCCVPLDELLDARVHETEAGVAAAVASG